MKKLLITLIGLGILLISCSEDEDRYSGTYIGNVKTEIDDTFIAMVSKKT